MRKPYWRSYNQHWYVEHYGRQRRLSQEPDPQGGSRKQPPRAVEEAWKALLHQDTPGTDIRLGDLISRYLENDFSADFQKSATHQLHSFEASVGRNIKASKLIPLHLSDWLKKRKLSPSSTRTAVNRVHGVLNWAVAQGLLDKNPILSTPGYKLEGYFEPRQGTVPVELAEQIEARAVPALAHFLRGLRETGARLSELRRARIEKLDGKAGTLRVPNKVKKKTRQPERILMLAPATVAFFQELAGSRREGYLFLTTRGCRWSYTNLRCYWRRTVNRCQQEGIQVPKAVTLYTYRHTFISWAINEADVNPALVAGLVGHSDLDMLMKHYFHANPEALKRAIIAINAGKYSEETPPPGNLP